MLGCHQVHHPPSPTATCLSTGGEPFAASVLIVFADIVHTLQITWKCAALYRNNLIQTCLVPDQKTSWSIICMTMADCCVGSLPGPARTSQSACCRVMVDIFLRDRSAISKGQRAAKIVPQVSTECSKYSLLDLLPAYHNHHTCLCSILR